MQSQPTYVDHSVRLLEGQFWIGLFFDLVLIFVKIIFNLNGL